MFHDHKADLSMEHVIMAIILLAFLVIMLIYFGVLGGESSSLFDKVLRFFTGT